MEDQLSKFRIRQIQPTICHQSVWARRTSQVPQLYCNQDVYLDFTHLTNPKFRLMLSLVIGNHSEKKHLHQYLFLFNHLSSHQYMYDRLYVHMSPLAFHRNCYWIPTGFQMDFHLYVIEISTGYPMDFNCCFSLKFQLDFQWIFMGVSLKFKQVFFWNLNWISNGIPLVFHYNFN